MQDAPPADIGIVGLAVMGQNLALNMADSGYQVATWNRTEEVTHSFVAGDAEGKSITGHDTHEDFVAALAKPRKVMLMIKAGDPVDQVIDDLAPLLEEGDVVIDGGNSRYTDTQRRMDRLAEHGIHYVGTGISGGELGARHGPSLMPGGSPEAWPLIKDIFQDVAAKLDDGTPAADWLGRGGAGHFVKMVHNGIEYADMQLIAEAYDLMRRGLDMEHDAIADVFERWDDGPLDSYLVEITVDILRYTDDDGEPLVTKILDAASQKGTGKWTVIASMELGAAAPLIAEAVNARIVSSLYEERQRAAHDLTGPEPALDGDPGGWVERIHSALYASKIMAYAQGFDVLAASSAEYEWDLDFAAVATVWREGTIIRSRFLEDIVSAFTDQPDLPNLLFAPFFRSAVVDAQDDWRRVVAAASAAGIPVPGYGSALAYYDAYRSQRLPANLIQAQRDYFGAHTYERLDAERGKHFHTDWTGEGGDATAGSYSA